MVFVAAEIFPRKYFGLLPLTMRAPQGMSHKTHDRLASTPEEWAHYHTMYRALRETWPVVPFKRICTDGSVETVIAYALHAHPSATRLDERIH